MYFVFKPILQTWRNELLHAEIKGSIPVPQPHWWDCEPSTILLPMLTFTVKENMPLLDNLFTGTIFDLYSENLIKVLAGAGVQFETFPVQVVTRVTQQVSKFRYKVFHLLEKYPVIDYERSDIDDETGEIKKLVLSKEGRQFKRPFFRVDGMEEIVLIHQELKEELELSHITGCNYIPVSEYQSGLRFYFDQLDNKENN